MAVFEKDFKNFFDIVTRLELVGKEEQSFFNPYFQQIIDNKLFVVLYDRKHDVNHAIRTALYSYLLCRSKNIAPKYVDMVVMAAIYHDSGLDRSKPKDTHGVESAALFEKANSDKYQQKDLEIIKRLIALHSSESNQLDLSGLNIRSKNTINILNTIYKILKDADAIDRNRLDYSFVKCKPRSFRLPESKALLEVADSVLFEYKKLEYVDPSLSDGAKFDYYYKIYVGFAKKFLPVKNEVIEKNLTSSLRIESVLGEKAKELFRVPSVLFYGSDNSFDLLKEKSDASAHFHLICSDSPLQSFFRTVFQNDVEVGIKIDEYFDEQGEYVVKYVLDEYVKGAIHRMTKDRKITIHVLDGNMFYKTTEDRYFSRDWTSRNYRKIYAMDKFEIDVPSFFDMLIEKKVLTYSPWKESKEIPNILNIVKNSYLPRLKNSEKEADYALDEIIDNYYPKKDEFVRYLKEDIKKIMINDNKLSDKNYDDRVADVEYFIETNFMATNSRNEFVYNSKKINDYINNKKVDEEAKIGFTGGPSKLIESESLGETHDIEEYDESPLKGYIAMILLSAVVGILFGGIVAVIYFFVFR